MHLPGAVHPALQLKSISPCRSLQHLPSLGGLLPEGVVQHAFYDCTVLPVIGTDHLCRNKQLCRAACSMDLASMLGSACAGG